MQRTFHLIVCSLALAVLAALLATAPARAGEITVCPPGSGPCDHPTVQAAVDASAPGDVIKIAAGTYTGTLDRAAPPGYDGPTTVTQMVYITQSLTLRGGYTTTNGFADPPDPARYPTTLDAERQGRGIFVAGEISVTLEGLRVVHGYADANVGRDGGGVCVIDAHISITNSIFNHNEASTVGGAFYVEQGSATLISNTIISNTASAGGGGGYLYLSEGTLISNTINANNTSLA
jgi:hypothetical protein